MTTAPRSILAGLIGSGIQASRSPRLHEAEGEAQGLRSLYRLIDLEALGLGVADLPDLLKAARRFGFAGLNITHPCKQAILPHLDALSADAEALGAVNTVVFGADGTSTGHNTDWWGFAEAFRRGLPEAPLGRVVQLGAGGAGAAVAYAALRLGAGELTLFDVEPARAEALADSLNRGIAEGRAVAGGDIKGDSLGAAMAAADGLVHATPTGMVKYPGLPLPAALLEPRHWVAEIVYFPLETELLRTARARGCRTLDGGGMAVFQAVGAFQLFTGLSADADRMLRHFATMGPA